MSSSLLSNLTKMIPEKRLDIFGKNSLLMTSLPYYTLFFILFFARDTIIN